MNIGTTLVMAKKEFYELLFTLGTEVINLKIILSILQALYICHSVCRKMENMREILVS
jgi:hypothetical protein